MIQFIKGVKEMNIFTKLRKENGFKQKELAEKLNIRPTTISNWENLGVMPDYPTLIKLADIYEVSTDLLLGREDDFGNVIIKSENGVTLSSDEKEILTLYKQLDNDQRIFFTQALKGLINNKK